MCPAWRTDNTGPHSVDEAVAVYRKVAQLFPNARLQASDAYDDFIATVNKSALPTVTGEIGDSWIHGVSTDPVKVAGTLDTEYGWGGGM